MQQTASTITEDAGEPFELFPENLGSLWKARKNMIGVSRWQGISECATPISVPLVCVQFTRGKTCDVQESPFRRVLMF